MGMVMETMNARVSHHVNGTASGQWRRAIAKPRLRTLSESRRRPFAFTWTMSSISSDARPARRPPPCWASLGCWARSAPDPTLRSRLGLVTATVHWPFALMERAPLYSLQSYRWPADPRAGYRQRTARHESSPPRCRAEPPRLLPQLWPRTERSHRTMLRACRP